MTDVVFLPAATRPISLAAAKEHLRRTSSDEDTLINALISAATGHVESWCRRALVKQTRKLVLDCFSPVIVPQRSPLRSVSSIQYLDTAGDLQTLSSSRYRVDTYSAPGRIVPAYGDAWPSTYPVPNAVIVTYIAGHLLPFTADAASDVLTCVGHGFADGDSSRVQTVGGTLPTGLSADTDYYVVNKAADTLQLASSAGGSAIDITAAGSAPNALGDLPFEIVAAIKLLLGHLYNNREENSDFQLYEMPLGVERLLSPFRVTGF